MDRLTDLDDVRTRVWDRLAAAADDPGHAFRTLTFGTAWEEEPHLRTVILRSATPDERRLAFHSDRRSQKIEDIRANERIAWLGWDPEAREQVRLHGSAAVHVGDAVADAMWADENPSSLDIYVRKASPGTPLDAPDDAIDPSVKEGPVTEESVAPGKPYFAVIRTVIDEVEWLHLHPEGHYRAQFEYDPFRDAFEGTWIVP